MPYTLQKKKKKNNTIMIKKRWILAALLAATLLPARAQVDGQEQKDTPRWSLSSNLLSWATLAPNVGAEVYFAGRWSVAFDGSFGMWGFGTDKTATQTWSVGGELRRWLQTSHYGQRRTWVGVSVRGGEFDENFFSPGRRGSALLAGATVGYRFWLPRRWRVDASLGLGYVHLDYDKYFHNRRFDVWELEGHRTTDRFGLTNLNVALVYLF